MKYRFMTVLHRLKLESIKNRGIQLYPGARISNGSDTLRETLATDLLKQTAGFHSINEFKDATYLYIDGEVEEPVLEEDELNKYYSMMTFTLLRQAQDLSHYLWRIKDNNVYVRDGFLVIYKNDINVNGLTYKASLSEMFSYSDCNDLDTAFSEFSDREIQQAIANYTIVTMDDYNERNLGGKHPDSDHLLKNGKYSRLDRAQYFIGSARDKAILPMKILSYCTALECLFTTSTSELTYRIAERVALLLGTSEETKKHYFKVIKDAYNCRSKVVHGQQISKHNDESLSVLSKELDEILRQLIINKHDVFYKSDNEIDEFFLNLVFA